GEPDFDTPDHIKEAAKRALDEGFTKYTPASGIDELKEAVCKRYAKDYGVNFDVKNVIISCGGKHALYNALLALLNTGDEVIIVAPYWVSYPPMVELAGGVPKIVHTSESGAFAPTVEQIESAITPATRAVIVNSPSNPTGCVIPPDVIEDIYELCRARGIVVISDEIYDRMVYESEPFTMLKLRGADFSSLVVVNGASKTYSMTGWRIGYTIGDESLIAAMGRIQSQSTSNPTSFAQKGALEALLGPQDDFQRMLAEFDERRRLVYEGLNSIEGITACEPKGAFYIFPNFSAHYGKRTPSGGTIGGSLDMGEYLLNEAGVCLVPGEPFGSDAHLRMSFAASRADIEEGLDRIEKALAKLE
ncbi:MAG TPA: pyridoxal phosphate-dependent aminotransferase, partial [Proteobacteria bacterium]|nr:pyridoxal phosphate-dependent aminotransferase [Pseudomonadota bacterium]